MSTSNIRPIQGSNWAKTGLVDFKVEAVCFNTKFQQKTTNSNIDTDTLLSLLSIIFVTQKTPIHHGGFDGDFWISLQEVISVNYHLNQDYHDLLPWIMNHFFWLHGDLMNQDLCLSRKKTAKHGGHFGISARGTRQGRGEGELVFPGGIYIQRKMITVHWGDVCVFWFLYIYICIVYTYT